MASYAEHTRGWGNPGRYEARSRPPLLGDRWVHAVVLNNCDEVAHFDTRDEAELEAAKRNYAQGSYSPPRSLEPTNG